MTNYKNLENTNDEPSLGTRPPVKYAELTDTKLAYVESGAGDGEPVVFLHGGLSDYRAWSEQSRLISRSYRAVSYSRRYHYPNPPTGDGSDYTPSRHAADLAGFLKSLNIGKAHLVGRSCGALIALLAAVNHPELVRSLVLGEPGLFTEPFSDEFKSVLSKQRNGFNEAVLLARKGKKEWAVRQFLNVTVGADLLDQMPNETRSMMMENFDTLEPMLATYYELPPLLGCDSLKQVRIPTLLVSGEFSPRICRLNNEKINSCLPDSQLVVLQSASHGLHLENSEGFNNILFEFLSNH